MIIKMLSSSCLRYPKRARAFIQADHKIIYDHSPKMTTISPMKTILFVLTLTICMSALGAPIPPQPEAAPALFLGLFEIPMANLYSHLLKLFSNTVDTRMVSTKELF